MIEMGNAVLRTRHSSNRVPGVYVDSGLMKGFRSVSLSFIQRVYGQEYPHYREFSENTGSDSESDAKIGLDLLRAIRDEIAGDWLFTLRSLVTAEVFADYLEMAEYLLESSYKDPAAVIAGSTLEEHLRQLCIKNGIPIVRQKDGKDVPLTGDPLNVELAKAGVYNKVEQMQVTAWLGIRNSAAHGKYGEYDPDKVKGMISGVVEFIAKVCV